MNCFQIVTFMWWITIVWIYRIVIIMLWIAFKLLLLCDESQSTVQPSLCIKCCELLSNCYFYVMNHNSFFDFISGVKVVNCFQIVTFMWWITIKLKGMWGGGSCELLSNCYFYVMNHNTKRKGLKMVVVVNCFQIVTFMWWITIIGRLK